MLTSLERINYRIKESIFIPDLIKSNIPFKSTFQNIGIKFKDLNNGYISLKNRVTKAVNNQVSRITDYFLYIFSSSNFDPQDDFFRMHINDKGIRDLSLIRSDIDLLKCKNVFNKLGQFKQNLEILKKLLVKINDMSEEYKGYLQYLKKFTNPFDIQEPIESTLEQLQLCRFELEQIVEEQGKDIFETFNKIVESQRNEELIPDRRRFQKELAKYAHNYIWNIYESLLMDEDATINEDQEIVSKETILKFKANYESLLKQQAPRKITVQAVIKSSEPKINKISQNETTQTENVLKESIAQDIYESNPSVIVAKKPLGLQNLGAYSCYVDSVLEMLLASNELRSRLYNDPSKLGKEYVEVRREIRKCLIQLIESQMLENANISLLEYYLMLKDKPNLKKVVRELIDIFYENFDMGRGISKTGQNDAAIVLEKIMDLVVGEKFHLQTVRNTPIIPGRVFYFPKEVLKTLQINFPKKIKEEKKNITFQLQDLVDKWGESKFVVDKNNSIKFTPQEGYISDEDRASTLEIPLDKSHNCDTYREFYQLKSLPDILPIHMKRFAQKYDDKGNPVVKSERNVTRTMKDKSIKEFVEIEYESHKIENEIILPKNGIIDLSSIYSPKKPDPRSAKYEITGMVLHSGKLGGGHYTSKVRIGKKYFHVNDLSKNYEEISKKDFYDTKDCYLILCKRDGEPKIEPQKPNQSTTSPKI